MSGGRTRLLVGGAVLVLAVGGAGWLLSRSGDDSPDTVVTGEIDDRFHNVPTDGAASTDGATPSRTAPRTVVNPPPEDPADVATDTATPTAADVRITYALADEAAGHVAVAAMVVAVLEDGGECRLTLERSGRTAVTTSEGLADVTTTTCGQMVVPFAELAPGEWTATVDYRTPGGELVGSAATTVEVPA